MDKNTRVFLERLKKDADFGSVEFVILFGSRADGKSNKMSDYDFAVYFNGNKKERFNFRKKILGILTDVNDVVIFQDLPIYVQKEVLKGKVIYAKNLSFVYDTAYETIKRFDDFKKIYYDYINMEKMK